MALAGAVACSWAAAAGRPSFNLAAFPLRRPNSHGMEAVPVGRDGDGDGGGRGRRGRVLSGREVGSRSRGVDVCMCAWCRCVGVRVRGVDSDMRLLSDDGCGGALLAEGLHGRAWAGGVGCSLALELRLATGDWRLAVWL